MPTRKKQKFKKKIQLCDFPNLFFLSLLVLICEVQWSNLVSTRKEVSRHQKLISDVLKLQSGQWVQVIQQTQPPLQKQVKHLIFWAEKNMWCNMFKSKVEL